MTDEARQRALAVIASAEASLAEYRDPDVVARAEAWQRDYDERNPPKPAPIITRSAPAPRQPATQTVSTDTLLALADEIGAVTGALAKRLDTLERESQATQARLVGRIARLEATIAKRLVMPLPSDHEARHVRH